MITLNGSKPWEYLGVLNVCLRIMLTIISGAFLAHFRIFDSRLFIRQAVTFVFYVALPSLVVLGLGINIDIYDDDFLWTFIGAFFIVRGIALVASFFTVFFSQNQGIGEMAVLWIAMSWISTVILGVPICAAVFNNPSIGVTYGVLAGISSFLFQLPVMLLFLECHRLEQEYLGQPFTEKDDLEISRFPEGASASNDGKIHPVPQDLSKDKGSVKQLEMEDVPLERDDQKGLSAQHAQEEEHNEDGSSRWLLFLKFSKKRDVWVRIFGKLIRNPVMIAIALAFFLTLTTLGPKYLRATSEDFVPGLAWFPQTLEWLSECVSPVSLLVIGVWMHGQGAQMFQISITSAFWFMLIKLVITPLIMMGLAKGLDFDDEAGRAAILIAALPISMAAFSLGSRYQIGEAILSENVALGTLLILPTILLWNMALDCADIFPIPE